MFLLLIITIYFKNIPDWIIIFDDRYRLLKELTPGYLSHYLNWVVARYS